MDPTQEPNLKFLHSEGTLNRVKRDLFRRLSTSELRDGMVLDGHHRLTALVERGEDVDRLPREMMEREDEP
jgi:hypothetical protein